MTYIGAEEIISPLGINIEETFQALVENRSGIQLIANASFNGDAVFESKIADFEGEGRFTRLVTAVMEAVSLRLAPGVISSPKTLVIVSSTKGELASNIKDQFGPAVAALVKQFNLANDPVVVSNACISGVLAINAGNGFIKSGLYEHVVVIGCDVLSDFVLFGFQSLFAISDKPCMPFDAARNGITMGEGCGAVVLSLDHQIFRSNPLKLLSGTSANDANHISGPSRTGEGLYRSVKKTLNMNGLNAGDIDFISAHGTGTLYNDEMESVAFDRLDLTTVPVNSLKGYFGHTLGAAGVIETAVSMQMIRSQLLIKSLGFSENGTSKGLNVILGNRPEPLKTVLKTASGFGGGNASLILQAL